LLRRCGDGRCREAAATSDDFISSSSCIVTSSCGREEEDAEDAGEGWWTDGCRGRAAEAAAVDGAVRRGAALKSLSPREHILASLLSEGEELSGCEQHG
jgi:hypothetical protein